MIRQLYWLPLKSRIEFKILVLMYQAMHDLGLRYLNDLLVPYHPQMVLRSTDSHLLVMPRTSSRRYGDRAFENAAPRLWNSLATSLHLASNLNVFKIQLKTYLFREI